MQYLQVGAITYTRYNAEQFTNDLLNKILDRDGSKNDIRYSCKITINQHTGYVNIIDINN